MYLGGGLCLCHCCDPMRCDAVRVQYTRTEAMDEAAKNGHLDVVTWLHENRQEGCTGGAMDMAGRHGHLEVTSWLGLQYCKGLYCWGD